MSKSSKAVSAIYLCLSVMRKDKDFSLSDKYLDKYVPTIPIDKLVLLKKNEKNPKNKDDLDILIARKIRSMEHILAYNPPVLERYLSIIEEIKNIDAICILVESKNDKIFEIAYNK